MKNKYKLEDIREVWIDAFFNAKTDWLDYLEAPFFYVKKGESITTKNEQISFLKKSRIKFQSPNNKITFHEKEKRVCIDNDWATISGQGSIIKNGNLSDQFKYCELWLQLDNRWQISTLLIEDYPKSAKGNYA